MEKLVEIISLEQYEEVIKEKSIIMFTADWCPDCVYIKPHMDAIVEEFPNYKFYFVNRDNMIELCKDLNILGIPSFVGFNEGKEIGRLVNKLRKTKEEVVKFINQLN